MTFKSPQRKGFALMEVMLALAMVSMLLTTFMMVQTKVFKNTITSSFRLERFYFIRNMFLETKIKPLEGDQKTWKKKVQDPEVALMYEKKKIDSKSELARFKGLYQEVASGKWSEWNKEIVYDIISYQFEPPKESKKNETP